MKDNLKGVGIWGQRHYQYLKENKPSIIGVMRMNGSAVSKRLKTMRAKFKDVTGI